MAKKIGLDRWIDQKQFQQIIEAAFHKSGYMVFPTPNNSGFQMRVKKGNEHSLVRCKSWAPNRMIDVSDVIELHGHMSNLDLNTGWFICISDFTIEAVDYARSNGIVAVDADNLQRILDYVAVTI